VARQSNLLESRQEFSQKGISLLNSQYGGVPLSAPHQNDRVIRLMDKFLSKWLTQLDPEEFRKAILSNTDPRVALSANPELRQDLEDSLGPLKEMAMVGSFITGLFTNFTKNLD
jgi:hypothetical protein